MFKTNTFFQRLTTLSAILALSVSISALTFTVTVPEGTHECYIAGNFTGWSQQKMTKIDNNKFQIEIDTDAASAEYKYCSGPGWEYVEKSSGGSDIANRKFNENDIVARWAAVYEPDAVAGDIHITATVPENTPDGEVYITGSFVSPSWDPDAALQLEKVNSTTYKITIPDVTVIQYKLLCGRGWEFEELSNSGGPIENRHATAEEPNVNITVAQWRNIPGENKYITHTFSDFSPLQGNRRILIYLPPDYDENPEKRYPVLYMHDGQNVFESGAFGSWNMEQAMQQLYDAGENVGVVVTIDNSAGRLKEYAPFGNPSYEGGVAQGDEYLQAIKNHIIPYVNANFRTLTDRENTGICGSSMGGLISYYAGLKEHDTFGRIGVMSPSFWFCKTDLNNYVADWSGQYTDKTRMYFICGTNEDTNMVSNMQAFYDKTKAAGFSEELLKYEVVQGAGHNEAAWAAQIVRVYQFLFEEETGSNVDNNRPTGSTEISTAGNRIYMHNRGLEPVQLSLFTVEGRKIEEKEFTGMEQFGPFKSGVYIAGLAEAGRHYAKKIIIP